MFREAWQGDAGIKMRVNELASFFHDHQLRMERGKRDEFQAVVNQLFVNFIGEDDEIGMFHDDVCQSFELGRRVGVAGGVGGGIDNENFAARADGFFELFGGDLKAIFFLAADDFVGLIEGPRRVAYFSKGVRIVVGIKKPPIMTVE